MYNVSWFVLRTLFQRPERDRGLPSILRHARRVLFVADRSGVRSAALSRLRSSVRLPSEEEREEGLALLGASLRPSVRVRLGLGLGVVVTLRRPRFLPSCLSPLAGPPTRRVNSSQCKHNCV